MSRARATIEGLPELQAKLLRAMAEARIAASGAIAEEVEAVRQDATEGAPLGPSGDLREGIIGDPGDLEGTVSSTARHAGFVEHGTYKDEAQPYMAPAAERSRKRYPARLGAAVKVAVEGIRR